MSLDKTTGLFWLMCLIWGVTWIAVKVGVEAVPPLFFASSRFIVAGSLLYGLLLMRREPATIGHADWGRLIGASLLLITACYGLLFWGMLFISSGLAALLEQSFTPVALLGFALLLGQEPFDRRKAAAIALGVVGIAILFAPQAFDRADRGPMEAWGAAAVVAAAVVYGGGSVLAKPLVPIYGPVLVAASTMVVGGVLLLGTSLALEPRALWALRGQWGGPAWAGWAFLVLFGSLGGYTAFMHVLREWGASKAGSFAFISPVIAVAAGAVVFDERLGLVEASGMAVMLLAAWLALRAGSPEPR